MFSSLNFEEIQDHINMLRLTLSSRCSNQLNTVRWSTQKSSLTSITTFARNLTSATNPDNLPHFPVPKLNDTLQKFLRSVQPLLPAKSYKITENLIKEFGKSNGLGEQLQRLLQNRADTHENWLADWWLIAAYLTWRSPVVVYSNPGLYFPTRQFANADDWLKFSARVTSAALRYKQMVDSNQIPKDKMGKTLLDMGQYKKVFGTCRIPGHNMDSVEFNPGSRHIVVAYRNGFYKVPVYGESSNDILSEVELFEQFQLITANKNKENIPIGMLSSQQRDTLAKAYEELIRSPLNAKSIESINKALFIVCLDKSVPFDKSDEMNVASHQLIHGGGSDQNSANRWFNKTIQFIINENGLNGLNYEHSPAEGQPIAVLSDFINTELLKPSDNKPRVMKQTVQPQKLEFSITQNTQKDILEASKHIDELANNLQVTVLDYKGYGKNFIKSQKMSPDSYLQMAMQYAFYKYYGVAGAHYETGQQRIFIHGRTETIRSCSVESLAFAKAMCDSSVSDSDKVKALRAAVTGHKDYATMAMKGEGIDRHLLGLKMIAKENSLPVPELYSDDGFVKSTHYRISTSQVASVNRLLMSYGPAVDDGYGLCYNPRDDDMLFAITAFKSCPETCSNVMAQHMTEALEAMYSLLLRAGERPISKM
ncbi:Carnitine O-acetyltransferase [Pseudolycoriella hygida]|uniref:Carnitine O-acetyltransferase n=1 Tax=Pseudolycoriella hygida TaxID=35572 RepID=A0A9Q0MWN8_9DIPT|nr:Carnitine O-acetyltransferase [Pseudolycoriella hygida]